ncbi:MAG: hypothetical protein ACE5H4_10815 [Candidatus Thorarchaeota archaeon]
MRRIALIMAISVILTATMLPVVAAPTDQGLDWGVETLDSFIYNVTIDDVLGLMGTDGSEKINLTVGTLSAIPDGITNYTDIPPVMVVSNFINGSPDVSSWGGVMGYYSFGVVLPIGNWSLLTELYSAVDTFYGEPGNVTFFEDWLHWGYTLNFTANFQSPSFLADLWITVRQLKADGVLVSMNFAMYNESSVDHNLVLRYNSFRDGDLPAITHPQDITYDEGATGYEISWSASDLNPAGYILEIDGAEVGRGLWNSSSEIVTLSVDGFALGDHECTIYFIEASGLNSSDTVIVSVNGDSTTTTTTTTSTDTTTPPPGLPDTLTLIAVVGGVGVLLIVIVILARRR